MRKLFFIAISISLAASIGCQPSKSSQQANIISYESMRYSKLFGIAHFKNYQQLFFIEGKDTNWSIKSTELSPNPNIVVLSSVFAGFLNELKCQDLIVGVDKIDYYNDSIILKHFASGRIQNVGEEGQLKMEKLIGMKSDLLISSSFSSNDEAIVSRLNTIGAKVISCDNFKEQHPLARAEWIKFFGFLTGKLDIANAIFNRIDSSYQSIKSAVDTIHYKPIVLTDALYMGVWNIPGGNSYTAQLIQDAGGQYIFKNKNDRYTYPLNFETVYTAAQNSDIWIHVNQFKSFDEFIQSESRYKLFKAYNTKTIFNYNKRENRNGGNDFWETGVVRPDIVLSDLVAIFSMDKNKHSNLFFYKRLN